MKAKHKCGWEGQIKEGEFCPQCGDMFPYLGGVCDIDFDKPTQEELDYDRRMRFEE
jgi:hypothetical protein